LALTLARDRKLGLNLAREIASNCVDFLAGVIDSGNPYTFSEISASDSDEFSEFLYNVEMARTIAIALDRTLTRELGRIDSYVRSYDRRRGRARFRNRTRALVRPRITEQGIPDEHMLARLAEFLLETFDTFYRSKPITVVSDRARDLSLDLSAAFDRLRIAYIQVVGLNVGLHQNLGGTDLRDADLSRAQLGRAGLRASNLTGAQLPEANLSGADLTNSYLVGAILSGADLTGAHLNHADLTDADLRGADLSHADISGAEPRGVIWSKSTSWPAAFEREMWARSREIQPGVFRVDEGGERIPLQELVPVRY